MNEKKIYKPEETRFELLQAAFKEIYVNGFQAASLNRILKNVNLTKGALYHHFSSKKDLGLSVVDEMISERMYKVFMAPLENTDEPISVLCDIFQKKAETLTLEEIKFGCPLNNLTQEMSPIDDEFDKSLKKISRRWVSIISKALDRGKENGVVKANLDTNGAALFIVASIEGAFSLGKNAQNNEFFLKCMEQLQNYTKGLAA